MKTLLCMRHGQTNYNVLGLCNDDPNKDVHLTELGRHQARAAAEQLRDAPLERIYVSELPRTHQTAAIINEKHRAPIEIQPLLNDIRSGFDSQPVADYFAAIAHDRLGSRAPGGESVLEHKARILRCIDWLLVQPHQCVLVVAHEETLRVFAARFRGLDDQSMVAMSIGNCEVLRFPVQAAL